MKHYDKKMSIFVISIAFIPMATINAVVIKQETKALVKAPVADLLGKPISKLVTDVEAAYEKIPFAPDKGAFSCLRAHQLKFNEVVTVKSSLFDDEVECEVTNLFFLDALHRKRSSFYTLAKNLIPLEALAQKIDLRHIPAAIDCSASSGRYNKNILTLTESWYDKKTKTTYSAGTRFVRNSEQDKEASYAIYIIDIPHLRSVVSFVPKSKSYVWYAQNPQKQREKLITLLRRWCALNNAVIPYVYGGCSFTMAYAARGFKLIPTVLNQQKNTCWMRNGAFKKPLSGFDCSNLLLCAAQICGIRYYCKNTLALVNTLKPIKHKEKLEIGDLIWYSGHVVIISDTKKGMLIEAVGYDSGHGKLHEIHVSKVFKDIRNYEDLLKAHFQKHALHRLHKSGKPVKKIFRIKVLKLM